MYHDPGLQVQTSAYPQPRESFILCPQWLVVSLLFFLFLCFLFRKAIALWQLLGATQWQKTQPCLKVFPAQRTDGWHGHTSTIIMNNSMVLIIRSLTKTTKLINYRSFPLLIVANRPPSLSRFINYDYHYHHESTLIIIAIILKCCWWLQSPSMIMSCLIIAVSAIYY